jgi:hypothetical protein
MCLKTSQNFPKNQIGKKNPYVKKIEFKGKVYYGWRELKEATGITKHCYNNYYLKGVDPFARLGTNGPIPHKKGELVND